MLKVPQAWENASVNKKQLTAKTSPNAKKLVAGKIDMSKEVAGMGMCPDCRNPMTESHAAGNPVLTCNSCRIALPMSDENIIKESEEVDLAAIAY